MAESQDYSVSLLDGISFSPENLAEEVLQNVRTILSTRRGTVPLDRDFGLSWSYLDQPMPLAQMQLKAEIITAIRIYEPRATIKAVSFTKSTTDAMDGILIPIVTVTLDESIIAASQTSISTGSGSSSGADGTVTAMLIKKILDVAEWLGDIEDRLKDIEQSDYSQLYTGVNLMAISIGNQVTENLTDLMKNLKDYEDIDSELADILKVQIANLEVRLADIDERLREIEQSDYSLLYTEGEV